MIEYILYGVELLAMTSIVACSFFYHGQGRNPALMTSYIVFSAAAFMSIYLLLGKPVSPNVVTMLEYSEIMHGRVVYVKMRENEYILLLIEVPGDDVPLYLRLPWNTKTAEAIQKAQQAMKAEGASSGEPGTLTVKQPLARSLETRPNDFKHEKPPSLRRIQKQPPRELNFQ